MTQSSASPRQTPWQRPSVQELGNLRDFVRHSTNANGKSGPHQDGNSACGGEAMEKNGTCPN
jgi:hypothetical protein